MLFWKTKNIFVAHFVAIVTVLGLPGTEPTILLMYACIVLVIYCCVMDYRKLNGIKNKKLLLISHFLEVGNLGLT